MSARAGSQAHRLLVAATWCAVSGAGAQSGACPASARDSLRRWTPPLDRVVTLQSSGASLRTALDLVAARAGVRLSYSGDALPLDREACVPGGPMPLGAALTALLHDLPMTPVSSGGLQVVLAPGSRAESNAGERTQTLDRVVVTGSAAGAAQRGLPYAMNTVQGSDLRGAAAPSLGTALNGAIPGLWIWGDSPTSLLSQFGSIRGASSFGVSAPKVFVDGIELSNPLLLTRITAESIERIEVIRGPQGAALYGADAISGVVNVRLRHDGATDGRSDATLRSSAGAAQSDYAATGAFVQEHTLSLRAGSAERSLGIVTALQTTGAVVPGGRSVNFSTDLSARMVRARTIISGTSRLWVARADSPVAPILTQLGRDLSRSGSLRTDLSQAVTNYTVGGTITHAPDAAWTHTVTAGIDGYRLSGIATDLVPIPEALDSGLGTTVGGADKMTVRATSVRRAALSENAHATLTFGADGALLRDETTSSMLWQENSGPGTSRPPRSRIETSPVQWLGTVGTNVQAGVNLHERLFIVAGVRGERNDGFTDASRVAFLPSVGATWVQQHGVLTWKVRTAYGAGVRPARNPMRETGWRGLNTGGVGRDLQPERQVGVETGVDLFWGRRMSLQVTRFDQRASSLIQQVPSYTPVGGAPMPDSNRVAYGRQPMFTYTLANLGAITNRGWELELRHSAGALTVAGSLSLVDSRVAQVATGYAGELRAGDRALGVPARTSGLLVTWTPPRWQFQVGATQVADWVNYDRLTLASTFLRGGPSAFALTGAPLRNYWQQYGAVTRLRASFAYDLTRSLTARMSGENLLDRQRGEPDNVTIVQGRTVYFGVGARF